MKPPDMLLVFGDDYRQLRLSAERIAHHAQQHPTMIVQPMVIAALLHKMSDMMLRIQRLEGDEV